MKRPEFVSCLKELGFTQLQFADYTGHHPAYVYKIGHQGQDLPLWVEKSLELLADNQKYQFAFGMFRGNRVRCIHCHKITPTINVD